MKKLKTILLPLTTIIVVVAVVAGSYFFGGGISEFGGFGVTPSPSPEPEFHEHIDLGMYVSGNWIDFSDEKYQSDSYEYLDDSIHLHDGNGTVVHLHKPGVTLQEFLETINFELKEQCLYTDSDESLCGSNESALQVLVNGKTVDSSQPIALHDEDRILVWYGSASDAQPVGLMNQVTDLACIYSKTCPERGEAPTEACIADPNVPCVPHDHE